jgi:methyl-accepting chemotaxis protein
MGLEEVIPFKDLGIGIIAIVIFYLFAEAYRKDFFKQLEAANKRGEEAQARFMEFIEGAYKDNAAMMLNVTTGVEKVSHGVDRVVLSVDKVTANVGLVVTGVQNMTMAVERVVEEVKELAELQNEFKKEQRENMLRVVEELRSTQTKIDLRNKN